jgi:hypothetical protein
MQFYPTNSMKFGIDVRGMDEVMNSINQFGRGINSYELNQWVFIVESTAKQICNNIRSNVELKAQGNTLQFSYEDERSKECLLRAIERHLYLMPIMIQGIFRKLANDIRSGAFIQ